MPSRSSRPDIDEYYLRMLKLVASRSTCIRRDVGAIITDSDGQVLGMGYNGVPRGMVHCADFPCPGAEDQPGNTRNCYAVHAEINAIVQCSRLDLASNLYVSCLPCFECAKAIANTKVNRIIFTEEYSDKRGEEMLLERGVSLVFKPR